MSHRDSKQSAGKDVGGSDPRLVEAVTAGYATVKVVCGPVSVTVVAAMVCHSKLAVGRACEQLAEDFCALSRRKDNSTSRPPYLAEVGDAVSLLPTDKAAFHPEQCLSLHVSRLKRPIGTWPTLFVHQIAAGTEILF